MSLRTDILTLFPGGKEQTGYIRVKCPFHKGGNERRPSMSIIIEDGHNGKPAGYARCFTCGWEGDFVDIAEYFGLQYVNDTEIIHRSESSEKPTALTTQQAVYKKDTPYKYSEYLASRGIFEETQKQYRVYEREDEHKVYLPVFSREGQYLFANARATDKKMFFIDTGAKQSLGGLDLVDFGKPIAVVESQINAMTLTQAGYCRSVALLGATKVWSLREIKDAIGPFLLMFDGDEAGRKWTKEAQAYLGKHRCIVYDFNEGEDVNNLWEACKFNQDLFFEEMEKRERK